MLSQEVLSFVEENDVQFIRLAFLDLFGRLKNFAIQPDQLSRALERGVPFDATGVDGFACAGGRDLLLRPDPDTVCILPWRPQAGRVCRLYCDILTAEGQPFASDPRALLKAATAEAAAMGLTARVGAECEFYLFEADEKGNITDRPQDRGGYMDVAPFDRGEDVRRDICLTLAQMNIRPESSHHERGPGQNEIDFHRDEPVRSADHLIAFYNAVCTIAARYGLRASFMPKPLPDEIGNGLHVNLALYRGQSNLFRMEGGALSEPARCAMAGVLRRLREITLFLNPIPNSYERLSDDGSANEVSWDFARGENALRVPLPQDRFARMQLQSPDPACNAYVAYALLIRAALEGVAEGLPLGPEYGRGGAKAARLPVDLDEALRCAEKSAFAAAALPAPVREAYFSRARELQEAYQLDKTGQTRRLFERL